MIKLCEDSTGYLWATILPEDVEDCENGPIIGPPEGIRQDVHNLLAQAGIYTAFDLMGNRKKLLEILKQSNVDRRYAAHVTHIYQRQYFEEKEDDNGD